LPKFASPCGLGQRMKDNQLAPNPLKLDIFVVTIVASFLKVLGALIVTFIMFHGRITF